MSVDCRPLTELQRAYLGAVQQPSGDLAWASTAIEAWAFGRGYIERPHLNPRPQLTLTGRTVCQVDLQHRVRVWARTVGANPISGRPVRAISASCSCHTWKDQTNEGGRLGIRQMRDAWRAHYAKSLTDADPEVWAG